jgi:chemotaxis protein MotB
MSTKSGNHPPIIIVRKPRKHEAHHGGAWKVAYADFVTAMMAFFLVMWLAAQDSRIRDAVAGYFKEPGLLPNEQSNSLLASGQGGIDPSGMPVLNRKPMGQLEAEQRALLEAAEHIRQHLMSSPDFASLAEQVEFVVTSEGLKIELVDRAQSSFFDTGSAVLRPETERILGVIVQEIRQLSNDIVVEGHTDSRPYAVDAKYGNWELSADRANAARRAMQQRGLPAKQLKAVRGFADTELRHGLGPLDARNRRVSIVVRTSDASQLDSSVRATGQPPR